MLSGREWHIQHRWRRRQQKSLTTQFLGSIRAMYMEQLNSSGTRRGGSWIGGGEGGSSIDWLDKFQPTEPTDRRTASSDKLLLLLLWRRHRRDQLSSLAQRLRGRGARAVSAVDRLVALQLTVALPTARSTALGLQLRGRVWFTDTHNRFDSDFASFPPVPHYCVSRRRGTNVEQFASRSDIIKFLQTFKTKLKSHVFLCVFPNC